MSCDMHPLPLSISFFKREIRISLFYDKVIISAAHLPNMLTRVTTIYGTSDVKLNNGCNLNQPEEHNVK